MQPDQCQFVYNNTAAASVPDTSFALWWKLKKLIWHIVVLKPLGFMSKNLATTELWLTLKKHLWHIGVFGPSEYLSRVFPGTGLGRALFGSEPAKGKNESDKSQPNLRPGDWVEIKSFDEIFKTLNAEGKHRGLAFGKEMTQYCGRRFRVFKTLEKIVLETTGELRRIKTPTVLLEGVFCTGEAHGNCDRSCFCFWREAWLKPVSGAANETNESKE